MEAQQPAVQRSGWKAIGVVVGVLALGGIGLAVYHHSTRQTYAAGGALPPKAVSAQPGGAKPAASPTAKPEMVTLPGDIKATVPKSALQHAKSVPPPPVAKPKRTVEQWLAKLNAGPLMVTAHRTTNGVAIKLKNITADQAIHFNPEVDHLTLQYGTTKQTVSLAKFGEMLAAGKTTPEVNVPLTTSTTEKVTVTFDHQDAKHHYSSITNALPPTGGEKGKAAASEKK